jgi:alpha-L-rhamnosidase
VYGNQPAAPLLRRTFELSQTVTQAILRIVGYGYYAAQINGSSVSDAVLDPPPSQYDQTACCRTIEVTSLLRSGANAIGVVLGRSYVSGVAGPGGPWTSEPRLMLQLEMTLANGKTQRVISDGGWKMADGPTRDWMYYGEDYDAQREIPGWTLPSFDDSGWAPAPVQPAPTKSIVDLRAPPVKVVDTFPPVKQSRLSSGDTVYDFGKITAGWARIQVQGSAGTKVRLAFGQQLRAEGSVVLVPPYGSADGKLMHVDTFVLKGAGREVWEPSFTRHGYQYVQVTVTGGILEAFEIEARECHTPVRPTGSFESSNALLNRLHKNHCRSLLLNHWGFPTDTSWRDRQGWTADTALYMDSALLNFAGLRDVYTDWLRSLRDTQQADGSVSSYAPDTFGFPMFNDPSWSGMLVVIPWTLYRHFGDATVLAASYPAMARWMDLMDTKITSTGDLYDGMSPGDHSSPGSEAGGTLQLSSPEGPAITRNAHLFQEARTLSKIAALLGHKADAARYEDMGRRVLIAFNATFFDATANVYRTPTQQGYRQTSNLMPLAFDMVPAGHREAVFANLVQDIEARGRRLNTGALGTKLILSVLTSFGRGDLAYAIATQTEYPSWGYWVTQGATASRETWRVEGPDQTLDHPFLGTFDDWLFLHLAGIQAASPGYAKIRLAPYFAEGLDYASATVTTPRGAVTSSWKRAGGMLTLDATLPGGVTSEVVLPVGADRVNVASGKLSVLASAAGRTVYATASPTITVRIRQDGA